MGTFDGHIQELRRLTIESRDLSVPVEYFHDQVVVLDEFVSQSDQGEHPLLEEMLRAAARRAIPDFEIQSFTLLQLTEHRLWHGAGHGTSGGLAVFLYFEDEGVGVAQIMASPSNPQTHFVRFTGVPLTQTS